MKTKKLPPFLAMIMAFEMIVAPTLAHAQGNPASMIFGGLSSALQAYSGTLAAGNQVSTVEAALLEQQKQFQPDEFFTEQKMRQIPGLAEYLRGDFSRVTCQTLRTTLHEVKFDGCSDRPSIMGIEPNSAKAVADNYRIKYEEIAKIYRNYSEDSLTGGQGFGVGCMKNAMTTLQSFFNARLAMLEGLAADVETTTSKFQEDSRKDMEAIEENTALLDGGNNELTNKVRTRRADLFDFSKRFNNPECRAIFPLDNYNQFGRARGLNDINQRLQDRFKTPGGKYSGESYAAADAAVRKDIVSLADKIKNQVNVDFSNVVNSNAGFGGLVSSLRDGVSSNERFENLLKPSLFSETQTKFTKENRDLQNELVTLRNELGPSGGSLLPLITNVDAGGFEGELVAMKNRIEFQCLKDTLVGTNSIGKVFDKIQTNESGKDALKSASNFNDDIRRILEDRLTSSETKLARLNKIDRDIGTRHFLLRDKPYSYTKIISGSGANAKTKLVQVDNNRQETPSAYFSNLIENCRASFVANNLGNSFSGATAIEKARELRNKYKSFRNSLQTKMSNEIKDRLINCADPAQANNTIAGSCGPESFNTSNDNFCAKAASDCSNKMKKCNENTDKFVTQMKNDRSLRVNNYTRQVEDYRTTLNNKFNAILNKFRVEGGALSNLFGTPYAVPSGIETQLPESARYLDALQSATAGSQDGALLLEDPVKYADMMKRNIDKLKASVVQQQQALMGSGSILNNHITQTTVPAYRKVAEQAESFANKCNSGRAFYENVITEQANKAQQLGQQKDKLCAIYTAGRESGNPAGFCGGEIEDLMAVDPVSVSRLKAYCRRYNNNDENNNDSLREVSTICAKAGVSSSDEKLLKNSTKVQTACHKYYKAATCEKEVEGDKVIKSCPSEKSISVLEQAVTSAYAVTVSEDDDQIEEPAEPAICNSGVNFLSRERPDFTGGASGPTPAGTFGVGR